MSRWVDGLEQAAARRLPEAVARYYRQGAGDGLSAGEAVDAWRNVRFRPHVLRDVSTVSTRTSLLGTPVDVPIAIAPSTLQRHADERGEVAMAAGTAAAGSLLCVSSNAGSTFEAIAAEGAPWWVQAYVLQDRNLTTAMLERAMAAQARAVVVTVDTPVVGTKEDGDGAGGSVWDLTPEAYLHVNEDVDLTSAGDHLRLAKAADLTPEVVGWLRDLTGLPVVVKGVLRGDDARRAVDAGAAAVWVSNHGGRQLDRSVTTRAVLSEVAAAVAGAVEVYVDGGIRHGLDALAALALGAGAVFVGRPALWALATDGAAGVSRLVADLGEELGEAMCLIGVTDVSMLRAEGSDLLAQDAPRSWRFRE